MKFSIYLNRRVFIMKAGSCVGLLLDGDSGLHDAYLLGLTFSILGKNCSRRHIEIFFFFSDKSDFDISSKSLLHDMSNPVF